MSASSLKSATFFNLVSVFLGLIGIINAGYLSYEIFSGVLPPCQPPFLCREVLDSPFMNLGPVPMSALGVVFFGSVFGVASWAVVQPDSDTARKMLQKLSWLGLAFALYTLTVMTFMIGGYCPYCLISDFLLVAFFGVQTLPHFFFKHQSSA